MAAPAIANPASANRDAGSHHFLLKQMSRRAGKTLRGESNVTSRIRSPRAAFRCAKNIPNAKQLARRSRDSSWTIRNCSKTRRETNRLSRPSTDWPFRPATARLVRQPADSLRRYYHEHHSGDSEVDWRLICRAGGSSHASAMARATAYPFRHDFG